MANTLKEKYIYPEPVTILAGKIDGSFPVHSHDFIEIAFVNGGRGTYIDNYGELALLPGDLFVMQKNDYHGFIDIDSLEIVNIIFSPEQLALPYEELRQIAGYNVLFEIEPTLRNSTERPFMNLIPENLYQLNDYVKQIEWELKHKKPGYRVKLKSALLDIIIFLSRNFVQSANNVNFNYHYRLGETIAYIQTHDQEQHSLNKLAKMTGMSKPHLIRKFKTVTGLPPIDYINKTRINQACKLLIHNKCTIVDAALKCGFSDSNYFSRIFKKFQKISPRQYINIYLKK